MANKKNIEIVVSGNCDFKVNKQTDGLVKIDIFLKNGEKENE